MADKVIVDCGSGASSREPLTQAEQDDLDALAAEAAAREEAAGRREQRRQAAIARLEAFWADRDSMTAGQVRTEAAFVARVLAKVLPLIDLDPVE